MYQYSINAGSEVLEDDKKKSTEELLSKIAAIEAKYNANPSRVELDAPDSLGLEKLQYEGASDEEIQLSAEKAAEDAYQKSLQSINSKNEQDAEKIQSFKTSLSNTLENRLLSIDSDYDDAKKSVENQAIRRGLARSSIIMGQIQAFDESRLSTKHAEEKSYAEAITDLENKLYDLEAGKAAAIEALDIDKLNSITEQIQKLTKERDDKLTEVLKYNNTVSEKEAKYKKDLDIEKLNLQTQALKNLTSGEIAKKVSEEKLSAAKTYFDSATPSEAVALLLTDSKVKEALGNNYTYLLNYYRSKI